MWIRPSGDDGSPSRGAVCRTMEYFDFNLTLIEKWDCQAKMEHAVSGTHSHMMWLGYPRGFRAAATSDNHLDDEVVELRKLDGARINPHITYTPDDGGYIMIRELSSLVSAVISTMLRCWREMVC